MKPLNDYWTQEDSPSQSCLPRKIEVLMARSQRRRASAKRNIEARLKEESRERFLEAVGRYHKRMDKETSRFARLQENWQELDKKATRKSLGRLYKGIPE